MDCAFQPRWPFKIIQIWNNVFSEHFSECSLNGSLCGAISITTCPGIEICALWYFLLLFRQHGRTNSSRYDRFVNRAQVPHLKHKHLFYYGCAALIASHTAYAMKKCPRRNVRGSDVTLQPRSRNDRISSGWREGACQQFVLKWPTGLCLKGKSVPAYWMECERSSNGSVRIDFVHFTPAIRPFSQFRPKPLWKQIEVGHFNRWVTIDKLISVDQSINCD